ncbi:DsbA family protein [uncultured Ruegeria sp.]|uniref:DsbA family protein n=1 Tax=uncultured Ruegeria sp. TaxID=259304 RepID=UPI00262F14B0|nr:DsbA family protein [uncultured Ruegeria sp.]
MPTKTQLKSYLAAALTSRSLQSVRRSAAELRRRLCSEDHEVHYFHDVADPYCYLTAQNLPELQSRYQITLCPHLISGSPSDAIPEPDAHRLNAQTDVTRLARKFGVEPPRVPTTAVVTKAKRLLAETLETPENSECLRDITRALWTGDDLPDGGGIDPEPMMEAGDRRLSEMGHYLGGTFFYGGEWYWGIDRLHYLEDRLQKLGLRQGQTPLVPMNMLEQRTKTVPKQEVEFFFSFRSPYSYLVFDRALDLAKYQDANLILRPVLPMLMRGMPVPKAKSRYILHDCAREARQLGIPFGWICDPLGAGVERGYALFDYADDQECLAKYCSIFLRSVWSEGVDAATDKGMQQIVNDAGLNWDVARPLLDKNSWRKRVEVNQTRLQEIGLWGVPSFYVNGHSIWGQDRLWAVEAALRM